MADLLAIILISLVLWTLIWGATGLFVEDKWSWWWNDFRD